MFFQHPKGAVVGTCDIWDTDYNTDNWESAFMTIFVTWQFIVTLDSIRNSCNVFLMKLEMLKELIVRETLLNPIQPLKEPKKANMKRFDL